VNQPVNNWYVFTGAPSSGKSTTIDVFKDKNYKTVPEMARVFIDEEIAKGKTLKDIEPDSKKFEEDVLVMKIDAENKLSHNDTILFDRGMHDTLAYYYLYGWPISDELKNACQNAIYKKVFLFEMLDYEKDYARVESEETAKKLHDLFLKVYTDAGYDVLLVPKASVEERVAFIEKHIKADRL
jgi:predicted ATPase